jgi:hypothetical protein
VVEAQRLLRRLYHRRGIELDDTFIVGGGRDGRGIHGHLWLEVEAAMTDEERAWMDHRAKP